MTREWCSFAAVLLLLSTAPGASGEGRPFSVRDAVEFVHIADIAPVDGITHLPPLVSPDGTQVLYVTRQGDLATNTNRYTLNVLRTDGAVVEAKVAARLASHTSDPAIADVKWIDDATVAFLGVDGDARPQVFILDLLSGRTDRRTNDADGVRRFSINARRDIAYVTEPRADEGRIHDANESGFVVTEQVPYYLSGPQWMRELGESATLKFLAAGASAAKRLPFTVTSLTMRLPELELSPDGRWIAIRGYTREIPNEWSRYTARWLVQRFADTRQAVATGSGGGADIVPAWFLVDTESGASSPLTNTPASVVTKALWSPDSKSVLVTHTMLPVRDDHRAEALADPAVLEVDLPDRKVREVMLLAIEDTLPVLAWAQDGKTLRVRKARRRIALEDELQFERGGDRWVLARSMQGSPSGTESKMLQGRVVSRVDRRNDVSPEFVLVDRGSGREIYRSDLNPGLRDIAPVAVRPYRWRDEDGDEWSGGLLLPHGYQNDRRYALVIQTHGYDGNEFLVDGPSGMTGFSARALAAQGFIVMQEPEWSNDVMAPYYGTSKEGPKANAKYESLVRHLDRDGLIDPARVGIIGFSRTDYHVLYLLVHGKVPIAAAALCDGIDFGYMNLMLTFEYASRRSMASRIYGALPLGEGIQSWIRLSPTFNAYRIKAPVRIEAIGIPSVSSISERYAQLRLGGVPTELTVYPSGTHVLVKPRERYRSQQSNVDWFRYWLKGEIDPDPAKAAQYDRWRKLREMRDATAIASKP